jgi:hypothetical protein
MKLLLSTLAAIVLVGAFTMHSADAACWWNGWGWQCWHPYWHAYYGGHPWGWGWHPYWHHYGYWHHW